jgi:hypothetical protein
MSIPKWVTPERQAYLVRLFNQSHGCCIYGHTPCKGHFTVKRIGVNHYGNEVEYRYTRRWHCDYGDTHCYNAVWRMGVMGNLILEGECFYNQVESRLIREWSLESRQDTIALNKIETIANHKTNDRILPLHGKYSGVSQDIYYSNQEDYFIDGYGINGITFKPFVKIRLASSKVRLFVDVSNVLKPLSKNQRHKALRYKHINFNIQNCIDLACIQAVMDFKRSK